MASATRRRNHHYVGAPWKRGGASLLNTTKQERTKQSKTGQKERRNFILPLVVKLDGRWGYKFGRLRLARKTGRL